MTQRISFDGLSEARKNTLRTKRRGNENSPSFSMEIPAAGTRVPSANRRENFTLSTKACSVVAAVPVSTTKRTQS